MKVTSFHDETRIYKVYHILPMNVCEYSPLLCVYNSLGINYRATMEKPRIGEIRALFFEVIAVNSQKIEKQD